MADIKKIKVGNTTYDIRDATKLPKVTYEWNKEFAAGSNGAISLGRYNIYDSQLTFDITSTTNQSLSGKLVIATQNGTIHQAKVFGDASGALVSKLIIYQSAISNSRSWVEVFCNFDGWSKNKVHIYAVALNSATVQKQMTSVTISNGVPAAANVTSGDTKWTGAIVNDFSHSHGISIAASSGANQLTLAHGTKYSLTAGGKSFIFTTPSDNNTHNSHAIISGTKSDGSTQIKGSASSGDITLGDSGVTAGTYRSVTVNSKGIVVAGSSADTDTNTWRKIQLNGTDKLGTGINTNPLNIKAGSNMTITENNGTFTFAATDTNTDTKVTAVGNHYKPANGTNLTVSSSGTASRGSTKVLTNIAIDAAGHITGGTWYTLPGSDNTDTKNTAGATNDSSKLFLIGAKSQAANPQTYSNNKVYVQDNKLYSNNEAVVTSSNLNDYLPLSGGTSHQLTAPVYIAHNDISFIGTAGAFGFRAIDQSGQLPHHLGQINLSKNFGGDGNQYGIQMSAVDITNNRFNQFRVYQLGIAYQHYDIASKTATDIFTVDTAGQLDTAKIRAPVLSTSIIELPESNLSLKFISGDNMYSAADFQYSAVGGAYLNMNGHLFLNEAGSHPDKPENKTGLNYMSYADYFDTGIAVVGKRTSSDLPSIIRLSFPEKSGILATLDDAKIEIVDLARN